MRVRIAVVVSGSRRTNHLHVLGDFDEERGLLVSVAKYYELALRHTVGRAYSDTRF